MKLIEEGVAQFPFSIYERDGKLVSITDLGEIEYGPEYMALLEQWKDSPSLIAMVHGAAAIASWNDEEKTP